MASFGASLETRKAQSGIAVLIFVAFTVQFGYFAMFEALWNGQTPGKRWTHLRVIQDSGRPISAYDAILRNLLRIVDTLPSLYAIGDRHDADQPRKEARRRLRRRHGGGPRKAARGRRLDLERRGDAGGVEPGPAIATAQLTVDELRLVETFFERRASLEPEVRRSMARQIAQRLGERLKVPAGDRGRTRRNFSRRSRSSGAARRDSISSQPHETPARRIENLMGHGRPPRVKKLIGLFYIAAVTASAAFAQANNGELRLKVTDPAGLGGKSDCGHCRARRMNTGTGLLPITTALWLRGRCPSEYTKSKYKRRGLRMRPKRSKFVRWRRWTARFN